MNSALQLSAFRGCEDVVHVPNGRGRIRTDVISLVASPMSARVALTMGLVAAGAFVVLSSINITAQGLYYDEIHQVPAALAYVGNSPRSLRPRSSAASLS